MATAAAQRLLAASTKIVGAGRNYISRANNVGNSVLKEPVLFLKPTSSFLHASPTAGPIEVHEPLESLHHEVELAVVISRRARDVPEASAMDFVGGYALALDMSSDDLHFNATVMLEMLRGKRMLFVGDALNRAQYVSLLCLLHRAVPEGSTSFETVDALSVFRAKSHDSTIEFYWAPLLAESNADDCVDHHDRLIRGAPMDRHSSFWKGADVLVFNSYLWWMTGDKIQILRGADNDMSKDIVEMGAEEAYRLVLHQVVRWLDGNVDPKRSRVFFVTASPTHASGQLWGDEAEGSNCHGQTAPIADASYWGSTSRAMLRVAGEVLGASARVPVGVVNVTQMSEYRRDAHTQVYREQWAPPTKEQLADPKSYADCTHWCLPGVPDAWNELLYWKLFFPANDQAL